MEIKLNFHMQSILTFVHFLENMELETGALLGVAVLLTPFVFFSLWSLGVAVLCQMFWLGVKAGIILFVVCSAIMAFFKVSKVTTHPESVGGLTCTLMDVILSVLFQTGLQIPAGIWDRLTTTLVGASLMNQLDHLPRKDNRGDMRPMETLKIEVDSVCSSGDAKAEVDDLKATGEQDSLENDQSVRMDSEFGGSGDACCFFKHSNAKADRLELSVPTTTTASATDSTATVVEGAFTGTRRRTRGCPLGGIRNSRNKTNAHLH